jgi:hypothetical protein
MTRSISRPTEFNANISSLQNKVIDLDGLQAISVQLNYSDAAPAVKTFNSLTLEVQTVTFPDFATIVDRDYVVVYNAAGTSYAVYADKTGTSIAPTGAAYLAATYKVKANISGATTVTNVTDIFETAFNTLTGFTTSITTSGTTTLILTQVAQGPVTNPVPRAFDDATAGTITGVQTTAGVTSNIDLTTDYITIAAHPYVTGTKVALTTAGGLPTGTTATNYWVIKIDANTIQLAASLVASAAGTKVNMTTEGTGQHTLTAAASTSNVFKLQSSNDGSNWTDVSGKTVTIATTTGIAQFDIDRPAYRYLNLLYTPSAGQIVLTCYVSQWRG